MGHLVGIEAAQSVVAHPADEGRGQPQIADPRQRVRDRAAGRLGAVLHRAIKHLAAFALDQLHDALLDPHEIEKAVVALGQHVDDGVADTDNLVGLGHRVFSSKGQRSRIRQSGQRGLRAVQM
jgi:hypothetical protein